MVVMYIVEKETGDRSKPVPIDDVVYRQNEIEFEFNTKDGLLTLPYSEFLYWYDDYKVVMRVKNIAEMEEVEEDGA